MKIYMLTIDFFEEDDRVDYVFSERHFATTFLRRCSVEKGWEIWETFLSDYETTYDIKYWDKFDDCEKTGFAHLYPMSVIDSYDFDL